MAWWPTIYYDDLLESFDNFLTRNMINLKARTPQFFTTALKGFLENYFIKKLSLIDKDPADVREVSYELDLVIALIGIPAWDDQYYKELTKYITERFKIVPKPLKAVNKLLELKRRLQGR